jgi:hypothetical protein
MWGEIEKYLPQFSSAVLTAVDAQGYPVSVRCQPRPDATAQILHISIPANLEMQPGPTGLLCHSHDEKLWNLKSFSVRGILEIAGDEYILRPLQILPGVGMGGPLSTMRMLFESPRKAKHYLQKRGLPQPNIPWEKIKALAATVLSERRIQKRIKAL